MDQDSGPETSLTLRPLGVVRSPFQEPEGGPIQPSGARGVAGEALIFPEYAEGLRDLEGFSHLVLLYHFHRCSKVQLTVVPFLDQQARGVFATRAPVRPNHLGLSVVRLKAVQGNTLLLEDVDILDGTPLLDIKPYVPEFDQPAGPVRVGWLSQSGQMVTDKKSDDRFS